MPDVRGHAVEFSRVFVQRG